MAAQFNYIESVTAKDYAPIIPKMAQVKFNCKVVGFLNGAYGKYAKGSSSDTQIFMEYNKLIPFIIPMLPWTLQANVKFMDWVQ